VTMEGELVTADRSAIITADGHMIPNHTEVGVKGE